MTFFRFSIRHVQSSDGISSVVFLLRGVFLLVFRRFKLDFSSGLGRVLGLTYCVKIIFTFEITLKQQFHFKSLQNRNLNPSFGNRYFFSLSALTNRFLNKKPVMLLNSGVPTPPDNDEQTVPCDD